MPNFLSHVNLPMDDLAFIGPAGPASKVFFRSNLARFGGLSAINLAGLGKFG
jgi:hypothetical protein